MPFWAGEGSQAGVNRNRKSECLSRTVGQQNAKASEVLMVLSKPRWALEGLTARREVPMLPALGLDSGKTNTLSQGHSVLSRPTWASLLTSPGIPLNNPRQPNFLSTIP